MEGLLTNRPRIIPQREMFALQEIKNFIKKMVEDSPEFARGGIKMVDGKQRIEELFEKKKKEYTGSKDEFMWHFVLKRDAEYEVSKEQIEYRNNQLHKILCYIESLKIWAYKFTSSDRYSHYHKKFTTSLRDDLHYRRFAHQNKDSLYYLSKSGLCIRLQHTYLLTRGIEDLLRNPNEVFLCTIPWTDNYKRKDKKISFPLNEISFIPKHSYQVEEFCSKELVEEEITTDFKTPLKVSRYANRLIIENFYGEHTGHIIDQVEKL